MRVAIIDVGSNNIKLEIHHIVGKLLNKPIFSYDDCSQLIFSEKIRACLGKENFIHKKIHEEKMDIALEALKIYKRIMEKYKCNDYIALGTAAFREAENRDVFLERVFNETGIQINVISGLEEARLVYLGVLSSLKEYNRKNFFFNDIGGGSTEISVTKNSNMYFSDSLPLGTLRLQEFFPKDYFTNTMSLAKKKRVLNKIRSYIYEVVKSDAHVILSTFTDKIVSISTGGTARNLLEIIQHRTKIRRFSKKHSLSFFKKKELKQLIQEIKFYNLKEIESIPNLDIERADIIFIGALILYHLMEIFNINKCLVSPKGLRDGALIDFCSKDIKYEDLIEVNPSYNSHFINLRNQYPKGIYLAQKFSNLVLKLSRALEELLNLSRQDLFILEYASLLFNIGVSIGYKNYEEHSIYILKNLEISFVNSFEIEFILLLIKYHNRGVPREKEWESISYSKGKFFRLLSIIKIAYSVVKIENNGVEEVTVDLIKETELVIYFSGHNELQFEVDNASKKQKHLEKVLNKKVSFQYLEI